MMETQSKVNEILQYAQDCKMKINSSESKTMLFNRSRKSDFMPELMISGDDYAEVVESMKLLGVIISSDLKWHSHINYLCERANSKLEDLINCHINV